jgi:DNA-binding transcriptional LysR family regulator
VAWAPPFEDLPPNPQLAELAPGHVPAFTSDQILVQLAAAEAGAGAIVLPRLRHRFSRRSELVPLDLDLGPFARGALHLVAARSGLDIPRVRLVAALVEAELRRVETT